MQRVPAIAETLAGRIGVPRLWPLSKDDRGRREAFLSAPLASRARDPGRYPQIAAGGFPEALGKSGARRARWFKSRLDTVLEGEVREIANIAGRAEFPRLMAMAPQTTGLLNHADLGRHLGIPQTTLKCYVALLESAFLVRSVPDLVSQHRQTSGQIANADSHRSRAADPPAGWGRRAGARLWRGAGEIRADGAC